MEGEGGEAVSGSIRAGSAEVPDMDVSELTNTR